MAGPPPTLLPDDPAAGRAGGRRRTRPTSSARTRRHRPPGRRCRGGARRGRADDVTVYAYARVGYHRSLDLLRRNGWKGHGPVPWEHEPNRGFLRCLAAPGASAARDRRGRGVASAARRSCATPARRRTTPCCGEQDVTPRATRSDSARRVTARRGQPPAGPAPGRRRRRGSASGSRGPRSAPTSSR